MTHNDGCKAIRHYRKIIVTTAVPFFSATWFDTTCFLADHNDSDHMHVTMLQVCHQSVPAKRFRQPRVNRVCTDHGHAKARTLLHIYKGHDNGVNVPMGGYHDIQVQVLWRAEV
jgi:hypothetical protein